jgi:hypothetical protein
MPNAGQHVAQDAAHVQALVGDEGGKIGKDRCGDHRRGST